MLRRTRLVTEMTTSQFVGEPSIQMRFPILASVLETYYKTIRVDDSEAMLGANLITAIVRPFTPGEEAIAEWVRQQDQTALIDYQPLSDGRDYIVLQRLHASESYAAALQKSTDHVNAMFRASKQHDTPKVRAEL